MSERATLADNSTVNTHIIENIAKMFLSDPDSGMDIHLMKCKLIMFLFL